MKKAKKHQKQRSNKVLIIVVVCIAIVVALAGYLYLTISKVSAPDNSSQTAAQQPTPEAAFAPYKASFQIIINDETRIFTDPRYHNKSAEVYIPPEGSRQVQVVVTKPNITWGILFATLPMSLTKDCIVTGTQQTFCSNASKQLRFYINDVESPDALITVIEPNSQLKVVY